MSGTTCPQKVLCPTTSTSGCPNGKMCQMSGDFDLGPGLGTCKN